MFPTTRTSFNKNKFNDSNLGNFTIDDENSNIRLATINSDLEKLYKKYTDIKKKRLSKEKTQQILVNRIKYLKNEMKRSVSKKEKEMKNKQKDTKIKIKIEERYINNNKEKRNYKNKMKKNFLFNDSESLSKISFNENDSVGKNNTNIISKNKKENILANKENEQNICNTISNVNNIESIFEQKRRKNNINEC